MHDLARRIQDHHLGLLARQTSEHHSPGIRRVHLVTYVAGWLGLATVFSQIPLGPTDAGTALTVIGALYMAALDPLAALLIALYTLAWSRLPFVPWGAGHGWLTGVAIPLAWWVFTGTLAMASHTWYHEDGWFLGSEPKGLKLAATLHVILFGPYQFTALFLMTRGWRPGLFARLRAAERSLCFRRERWGWWENWARTAQCRPSVMYLPESADDVVTAVREARARKLPLRVAAASFSWSSLVPTDGVLIFTDRLDALELDRSDPDRPLLVAGAGASNRQINTFLTRHGLALPWNVVLETVKVGGIVSTGTHGSGRATATMGDLLEAVELVDAQGAVRRFSAKEHGEELFSALRLGLGSFGVLTRVWMRVVPAVAMRQVDRKVPIAEALSQLERLVATRDSVELYWFPFCDWVWVRTLERTDAPVTRRPLSSRVIQFENFVQLFFLKHLTRFVRRFALGHMRAWVRFSTSWLKFREDVVPIADSQHYRQWIESLRVGCVEAAVPVGHDFENVRAAWELTLRRVARWAEEGRYPVDLTVNVRFTGRSKALLSAAWGHELTCWIEALCVERTRDWDELSPSLLGDWFALPGALPHWAKEFERMPGGVAALRARLGDRIDRFMAAREAAGVDPEGMFLNGLLRRLLGDECAPHLESPLASATPRVKPSVAHDLALASPTT